MNQKKIIIVINSKNEEIYKILEADARAKRSRLQQQEIGNGEKADNSYWPTIFGFLKTAAGPQVHQKLSSYGNSIMDPIVNETNWYAVKFTKAHMDELKPHSTVFSTGKTLTVTYFIFLLLSKCL